MLKCSKCGKEFESDFMGLFAEPLCDECLDKENEKDRIKREEELKRYEEDRKKHPEWYKRDTTIYPQ